MSLTALLDAEYQLGRLVQALEDGDHALWQIDALRREALASAELDGVRLNWRDLVVAELDPELLPEPMRPATALPLRLLACGRALLRGLIDEDSAGDGPVGDGWPAGDADDVADVDDDDEGADGPPRGEIGSLVAAARGTVADIEAFLCGPVADEESRAPSGPPLELPPLSRGWLAGLWRRLAGQPLPGQCLDDVEAVLDEESRRPGLNGVVRALYRLHQDGILPNVAAAEPRLPHLPEEMARAIGLTRAENRAPGPAWGFARLLAPWLVQRSHRLPFPGPWLSPAVLAARGGYAAAATGRESEWTDWLYPVLGVGFERERRRLVELSTLLGRWQERYGERRRWLASREALRILVEMPALTSRSLQQRRGITRRAAQMMVKDLQALGLVERVHLARGREWWIAGEAMP